MSASVLPLPSGLPAVDLPSPAAMLADGFRATMGLVDAQRRAATRLMSFAGAEARLGHVRPPVHATPHRIAADMRTMRLLDYSLDGAEGVPTIVDAPFAGHNSVIADFAEGQSLMRTLRAAGLGRLYLTDWKSATPDMRDMEIGDYVAELGAAVDLLGGRANLVGLCQGGWMSAMFAARFPEKVVSLVAAGSPLDAAAGDGPLKRLVGQLPMPAYQAMVAMGGGLMRGATMLSGWKGMHPVRNYVQRHIDIFENAEDERWLERTETFDRWYETTVDLPGRWYLQAIELIFKKNRFASGGFPVLGRDVTLADVTCPVYLLAGADDDITPPEQVFGARAHLGSPSAMVVSQVAPGGHIGLFMGGKTLRETWPAIGAWIRAQGQPDANPEAAAPRRRRAPRAPAAK